MQWTGHFLAGKHGEDLLEVAFWIQAGDSFLSLSYASYNGKATLMDKQLINVVL